MDTRFIVAKNSELSQNPLTIHGETFTLGEIANGYHDYSRRIEGGVVALGGKLNVRPKFQREYVNEGNSRYDWRAKLIHSVLNDLPIGTIYFGKVTGNPEFKYINIDGQQRIITLCDFIIGSSAYRFKFKDQDQPVEYLFSQLPKDWQDAITNYPVRVSVCEGSEDEMYNWFQTINQENTILTAQELRNASYCNGEFVVRAKEYFSTARQSDIKEINDAKSLYCANYWAGGVNPNRQEALELALDWASYRDAFEAIASQLPTTKGLDTAAMITNGEDADSRIRGYMAVHEKDVNATDLINHYHTVIDWVVDTFFHGIDPEYIKSKSSGHIRWQNWGQLWARYHGVELTDDEKLAMSLRCKTIFEGGITPASAVYEWVIRGEQDDEIPKFIVKRTLSMTERTDLWKAQGGIDPIDGKHYELSYMDAHHIKSWKFGGATHKDNMVMISKNNHTALHCGEITITPEELFNKKAEVIREAVLGKHRK